MFNKLLRFFIVVVILLVLAGTGIFFFISYISSSLPDVSILKNYSPPISTKIFTRDGHLLLEVSKEDRQLANLEEIPDIVKNAFIAAEDDKFYEHDGINLVGFARAALANIKAGRMAQGGSTITQQVAKSLLLTSEKTIIRKIKDMLLAIEIEKQFSKEEILYLYLNQVYLGSGYYGVKSAMRGYFLKELNEVTIAESALVAGLLVAPSRYSPHNRSKAAKNRQIYVLGRLLDTQKISKEEYEQAISERLKIQLKKPEVLQGGHFTDWVRQRVIENVGKEKYLTEGLEIVTTLDWDLQQKAQQEVVKGIEELDKRQGFKGPIKNFENLESSQEFLSKQRENILADTSEYFYLNSDGLRESQFSLDSVDLDKIKKFQDEQLELISKKFHKYIIPPSPADDMILSYIDENRRYQALVTKISDTLGIIYVSVAGITAVIPYDHFKWAHQRNISDQPNYYSYVKKPSQIVREGDVVEVKFTGKKKKVFDLTIPEGRSYPVLKEFFKEVSDFIFQEVSLEQTPEAEGALVSIDPKNGNVLAMVGGSSFEKSQFNRATQSLRQPGSAFKPFIYAAGLEQGLTPATIFLDSPQALGGTDDNLDWKPRNYDGKFEGPMTLRRSLEVSRNIPTILLLQQIGVDQLISMVERLKLNIDLPRDLSVSLGSFGISLIDLVRAYAIFPSAGKIVTPRSIISIKDRNGLEYKVDESLAKKDEIIDELKEAQEVDQSNNVSEVENPYLVSLDDKQVYDRRLAYIMTNLLKGVIQNGTGRQAADVGSFIAGKTGTTNNYVDAWFIGFSSNVVTGVWTGMDSNQTMGWPESGSKAALPIWSGFMKDAIKKYGESDFYSPSGIINLRINSETGEIAKSKDRKVMVEAFVEGTEPGAQKADLPGMELDSLDTSTQEVILEDDEYFSDM